MPKQADVPVRNKKAATVAKKISPQKPTVKSKINPSKNYLEKPVTEKKKTGEDNFLQLSECLLFDLEDFNSEAEYIVWYTAIAMNLYMHNSSYRPVAGYGKAQKRESEHELLYYRSQANHPHRILFDQFAKTSSEIKKKSLLPRNKGFEKLVGNSSVSTELESELAKLDARGFVKETKKLKNYFSLFLAYSGARANNLNAYIQALQEIAEDDVEGTIEALKERLIKDVLPKEIPKKVTKLSSKTAEKRIKKIQVKFKDLKQKADEMKVEKNLSRKTFFQRNARANNILSESEELKNLSIEIKEGASCVYINLYPDFTNKIRESQNYSEGITNAIIGFFGGLLNHHARQRGLFIHTDRRQSFGFLRPTLTDVGTMRMRLSLGLEPEIYNEIVIKSLKDLDELLGQFDFTDIENPKVNKYFEVCERARGKEATDKTGNYLLAAMRSDRNKWLSFQEAQHYLDDCIKVENPEIYLSAAFSQYLDGFIHDKIIVTENLAVEKQEITKKENSEKTNKKSTLIFSLLQNLVKYAIDFAAKIEAVAEDDAVMNLKNSYWHSLLKLYNNCDKAIALLEKIEKFEVSHLYAKANLLIENILEYLISLDSLEQIRKKNQGDNCDPVAELNATEKKYAALKLGLKSKDVEVYFTDSGQQAIVSSLLAMDMELFETGEATDYCDRSIFTFDESYYELELFLDKVGGLKTVDKENAKILFIDVTQLDELELTEFPKKKAVVIDVTNNPNLNNEKLTELISQLRGNGSWVVLVSSALKHDEIGLDKYQSGKIITLAPKGKALSDNVKEELEGVSESAMHPAIASYLQIVNHVFQEKVQTFTNEKISAMQLPKMGMFSVKSEVIAVTPQVDFTHPHRLLKA